MGQPMLPLQGAAIAADSTDESEVDVSIVFIVFICFIKHPQGNRQKRMDIQLPTILSVLWGRFHKTLPSLGLVLGNAKR